MYVYVLVKCLDGHRSQMFYMGYNLFSLFLQVQNVQFPKNGYCPDIHFQSSLHFSWVSYQLGIS